MYTANDLDTTATHQSETVETVETVETPNMEIELSRSLSMYQRRMHGHGIETESMSIMYARGKNGWTSETIEILERVRRNAVYLSEHHRKRFYHFKGFSKYFDLPVLILSAVGASVSVGMQPYVQQSVISIFSCLVGLIVSVITSVKLYLNISDSMSNELKMSKEFYTMAIDIFKTLMLNPKDRGVSGTEYLNSKYNTYAKLVEESNLLKRKFRNDHLVHAKDRYNTESPQPSTPSSVETPETEEHEDV